ncbi:MAG: hypothetical protein SPLUMA1_SPLUMAMAG1_01770 [uncultured Sulfurimonas sp.]|nr:MAG: hypothetical protein SPLUMA1_SPLUMAMAG1_01770 [uncultured Sulfurimonas sp.]
MRVLLTISAKEAIAFNFLYEKSIKDEFVKLSHHNDTSAS